jgi:ATP-binding protein involved in chromosome partitioning
MDAASIPGLSEEVIRNVAEDYVEPYTGKRLGETKSVKTATIGGDGISIDLQLGFAADGYAGDLAQTLRNFVAQRICSDLGVSAADLPDIAVKVAWKVATHSAQKSLQPISGIKSIIAIASGKGGVGKSTVSANLALALAADGASVGILDADIYGPSQPRMMGVNKRPESKDGKSLEPVITHGVQTMSIGFLVEEDTPMIWRGPMVTQALEQLLRETNWRKLDYLIIDLPPGTGDIQLTLSQKVPVSGAIIVTTPQDIALLDARKGLKMFEKVEVPVLGVVENMSVHVCSECGHAEHIFGSGGAERMARQYDIHLLGSLPLHIDIRRDADGGQPTVAKDPDGPVGREFREVARRIGARLSLQKKDYSQAFGDIVTTPSVGSVAPGIPVSITPS